MLYFRYLSHCRAAGCHISSICNTKTMVIFIRRFIFVVVVIRQKVKKKWKKEREWIEWEKNCFSKLLFSPKQWDIISWQWLLKKYGLGFDGMKEPHRTIRDFMLLNANLCSLTQKIFRLWKWFFSYARFLQWTHTYEAKLTHLYHFFFYYLLILLSYVSAILFSQKHQHAQCTHDQINFPYTNGNIETRPKQ